MIDLVSVIIPVYNAEKTINTCVESVLKQTYSMLQIILIDDGSTDNSLKLCRDLAQKDSRIAVFEKNNGGVSSARNIGLERARGKYLLFLDSDDYLEIEMIKTYIDLMNENNVDIIIGGLRNFSSKEGTFVTKLPPMIGKLDQKLFDTICISSEIFGYIGGKLFKKDVIYRFKLRFNEQMYAQEDLDFCLSYYAMINNYYLTNYAGYQYYFIEGKRTPPYCDFIRNQLKLLSIAQKKSKLSEKANTMIQQRICGYVYMMFYNATSKKDFFEAYTKMKTVNGLDEYLTTCNIEGEKKIIITLYLKGKYNWIYYYFKIRNIIKKLVKKNN